MKQVYLQKIIAFIIIITAVSVFSTARAQTLELVKDINTTSSSNSYPFDFNVVNDSLYFIAEGNSNSYGLWVSTGTAASTQMVSPSAGQLNSIPDIIPYKNKVYFEYSDANNNYELWQSNGTVAGTHLFDDIIPGNAGSYPSAFTVANDKLFFMAYNTMSIMSLYVTDGTVGGTVLLKNGVSLFNGFTDFAVLNNDIYFVSDNGSGSGYGLWKSDGTLAGTVLVDGSINPGVLGSNYAVLNNKLYFSADDNINGEELWVTDGTSAGTHIVINLYTGDGVGGIYYNGSPDHLTVFNNKIYFTGTDNVHGEELFVTDGTAGGTHIVKDIVPGTDGSAPTQSIVYNGMLYFSAGGDSAGLYKTDGTAAGTIAVKPGIANAKFPAINYNLLYIIANNDDQLFQTNGTMAGTVPIELMNTTNPVNSLSSDFRFQLYNGYVYLCASNFDVTTGFEFCRIAASVLPLQLVSFIGKEAGDKDVLNWVTANEVNVVSFTVEKSSDGKAFATAGSINSHRSNAAGGTYNFTYAAAANPAGYYRLKMTGNDGKYTYSKVIQLQRSHAHALAAFYDAYGKQVTITNNSRTVCYWKLLSFNGSLLKQGSSADATIKVSTSNIAAGTYVIHCQAANENISKSMVVY